MQGSEPHTLPSSMRHVPPSSPGQDGVSLTGSLPQYSTPTGHVPVCPLTRQDGVSLTMSLLPFPGLVHVQEHGQPIFSAKPHCVLLSISLFLFPDMVSLHEQVPEADLKMQWDTCMPTALARWQPILSDSVSASVP